MDALYIVRKGKSSKALIYSLRSLQVCFPVEHVFFMGQPEGEWQVRNVPISEFEGGDKWYNLDVAWRHMPFVKELSDPFVYMNDDFFFLKPMVDIPSYHRGLLSEEPPYDNYSVGRIQALDSLRDNGYTTWNFEVHTPMVINKDKIQGVYDKWGPSPLCGYQRSLYGNINQLPAEYLEDVKIREGDDKALAELDLFASCDPTSWYRHPIFKTLRKMYDKPCKWEPL